MDLLDRYLAAIARELPKAEAADIAAELRDTLLSAIEEKQAAQGRKLSGPELEDLLIAFGHPLAVAARYRRRQYLIGPDLFPFWLAAMRLVLMVWGAVAIAALGVVAANTSSPTVHLLQQALAAILPGAVFAFGAVTVAFAALEWTGAGRFRLKWSPRQLPPPRATRRNPFSIMSEMAMGVVVLLWWFGLLRFRDLVPIPPQIQVGLAPVWRQLHWPIAAYLLAELGINSLELFRPACVRLHASLRLVKGLGGCAILALVLRAGHWIDVAAPALPPHALQSMRQGFDRGMELGLIATAFVLVGMAAWDLWRLFRARYSRDGAPLNGAPATAGPTAA